MYFFPKLILLFIFSSTIFHGQVLDKPIDGELKMTFPSIYFKHMSTDYAAMPYSVDSCFKHIGSHYDESHNSLVIWKDSSETEELTNKRIKLLKASLHKYVKKGRIEIYSMETLQKIPGRTIRLTSDSSMILYLLSLNSVFDISKTRFPDKEVTSKSHILRPKITCWNCWKSGFHMNKAGRKMRQMARRERKENKTQ